MPVYRVVPLVRQHEHGAHVERGIREDFSEELTKRLRRASSGHLRAGRGDDVPVPAYSRA